MKLIVEHIEDIELLTEEKDGKEYTYIQGVFLQGDIKNRNGRVYPMPVLQREVTNYNENFVQKSRALGELGHPDGPTVNLDRVSHKITSLVQEGNNFKGKAQIMSEMTLCLQLLLILLLILLPLMHSSTESWKEKNGSGTMEHLKKLNSSKQKKI